MNPRATARLPLNRPDRDCHPHHPIPSHDARYAPRTTPPHTDIAYGPQLTAHNAQLTSTSPHYQVSGANLTTITFIISHCGIAIVGYLMHDATRMVANWLHRTPLVSSVLASYLKAVVVCAGALRSEAKSHWRLWWLHRNREDDWADSFFR